MRIVTVDIETSPNMAYVWSLWQENVPLARLVDSGQVMCWAAKVHGQDKVLFASDKHHGHEEMVRGAWDVLNEADVLVTYNGKKFDVPHLNREFAELGLTPPSPFHHVDLYQVVRSTFKFPSNKLDYVAGALGLGHKVSHTGFELWVQCMAGDVKAWNLMRKYNKGDVVLTEALFDKLRPWVKSLPHPGLYGAAASSCPSCGGQHLHRRGLAHTKHFSYPRFVCADCGKWSKGSKSEQRTDLRGL